MDCCDCCDKIYVTYSAEYDCDRQVWEMETLTCSDPSASPWEWTAKQGEPGKFTRMFGPPSDPKLWQATRHPLTPIASAVANTGI